jgi:7-carboxy-7-deazaguanine synthase
MFGKNVVTKPFPDKMGRLLVNDIFYTIQGEGPDAGRPAVFIRLAKCNLRCHFCDTEFETGKPQTYHQVARMVQTMTEHNGCRLVVITGGEPFLQNIRLLVDVLNKNGVDVSVETAGTVFTRDHEEIFMRSCNKIICSPKTPVINTTIAPLVHSFKYIVRVGDVDEKDGLPIASTQLQGELARIYRPQKKVGRVIYVQPMDEQDPIRNKANAELAAQVCLRHGYRLSLQMHKLVGVP